VTLSVPQRSRYARQLSLPEIGEAGQERLLAGRVMVIGAGGLGSPAALYLAAAGVGSIGIADDDRVEMSNLQRQILHSTDRIGRHKTASADETLQALNPDVKVEPFPVRVTQANAARLLQSWDFVIDATDSFDSKFLIADTCHAAGRPYSHAGITRYFGQTMTVLPGTTACYRCVFAEAPPLTDADVRPAGPLGAVPGVIGSIQAIEAIKFLLGLGELLTGRLLTFDALRMRFREVAVARDAACPLCGSKG
jgi:molybdopterin-synthase adenylyltransferase